MTDAWDPGTNDPFADEWPVDDLVATEPVEVEWLVGTSWRSAFDLPLEAPDTFTPGAPESFEPEPWEVDE